MVRVADLSYRVKNTFVEINGFVTDGDERARLKLSDATDSRGGLALEEEQACSPGKHLLQPAQLVPNTPSPFMHPSAADASILNCLNSMPFGDMLPPAFGEDGALGPAFDGQDMGGYYNFPMMYDPASGSYWCLPMDGHQPTGSQEAGDGAAESCEEQRGDNDPSMMQSGQGQWCPEAGLLLDAQGLADGAWHMEGGVDQHGDMMMDMEHMQDQGWGEGMQMEQACMVEGMMDGQHWGLEADQGVMMDAQGECPEWCGDGAIPNEEAGQQRRERWSDVSEGNADGTREVKDAQGWDDERAWRKAAKKEREREKKLQRKERQERERQAARGAEPPSEELGEEPPEREPTPRPREDEEQKLRDKILQEDAKGSIEDAETGSGSEAAAQSDAQASGSDAPASGGFTTVMLRNIPNKYTREMLVKQLNQDFRGRFDFVYLPIDFKNKCNVGYGFINFRTAEACDEFVLQFNGVDVRKCLPGLNSKKVAEVTPARVQGLDENVRRLRNGPVMGELLQHPEWMPLLLTDSGEEKPFPVPDAPCTATKGRRARGAAAREEEDGERPPREGREGREGRRPRRSSDW